MTSLILCMLWMTLNAFFLLTCQDRCEAGARAAQAVHEVTELRPGSDGFLIC